MAFTMVYVFIVLGLWVVASMTASYYDNMAKKILLDDINVGDTILIKGEKFSVLGYSKDGVINLRRISDDKEFYIGTDDTVKFSEHKKDGERNYITVSGFKGTVFDEDTANLIKYYIKRNESSRENPS